MYRRRLFCINTSETNAEYIKSAESLSTRTYFSRKRAIPQTCSNRPYCFATNARFAMNSISQNLSFLDLCH